MRLLLGGMKIRLLHLASIVLLGTILPLGAQPTNSVRPAQGTTHVATPGTTPNTDVRMIRMKLSAGDLLSAESILECHRTEYGPDGDYILGVAWLARGAALFQDWEAASEYTKESRQIAAEKLKSTTDYETQPEAVYALGTALEVEAQRLIAMGRKHDALQFLEDNLQVQEAAKAPYNIRARLWKRRNLIDLIGQLTPTFKLEEYAGAQPPRLDSLRGRVVVLFFWWEACGDCRTQIPALNQVIAKFARRPVTFIAPTRFYGKPADQAEEKSRILKAGKELFRGYDIPIPISNEWMLRYGVSATPTFAILDAAGIVRFYSPTRLSEKRLAAEIERVLLLH